MKKLFIAAALMIATGVYARQQPTPSYAQRAIDANSPEGMRLQNRVLTAEPIHSPQQRQININWTVPPQNKFGNIYRKLVNSKETQYYIGYSSYGIRCQIFLDNGALCTVDDGQFYIFIPAEDIENFENVVTGYEIPYNSDIIVCEQKIKPGEKHYLYCSICGDSADTDGHKRGWNLYRNGWREHNGIRIPIFSLKDPKAKPTDGSMVVPRDELKKRK